MAQYDIVSWYDIVSYYTILYHIIHDTILYHFTWNVINGKNSQNCILYVNKKTGAK